MKNEKNKKNKYYMGTYSSLIKISHDGSALHIDLDHQSKGWHPVQITGPNNTPRGGWKEISEKEAFMKLL